jgi:hypothetical protein
MPPAGKTYPGFSPCPAAAHVHFPNAADGATASVVPRKSVVWRSQEEVFPSPLAPEVRMQASYPERTGLLPPQLFASCWRTKRRPQIGQRCFGDPWQSFNFKDGTPHEEAPALLPALLLLLLHSRQNLTATILHKHAGVHFLAVLWFDTFCFALLARAQMRCQPLESRRSCKPCCLTKK